MFSTKLILKLILFLLALSLLLSACAETSTLPSPTPEPQATETVALPAFTLTTVPSVTVSPPPSRMPAPPKPSQPADFKATEIAKFPVQCTYPNGYYSAISQDGNWLAISCNDNHDEIIEIVNRDGQHQVLQFKDYLSKEYIESGIPEGSLHPKQWSPDGKFLYFAPSMSYSGGGGCLYATQGQGLYRINVDDGTVSAILPSLSTDTMGYFFAISPTGRRIVYQGTGNPTILDFKTGQQTILNMGMIGDPIWSPDGLELAYALCQVGNEQNDCSVRKSDIQIYSVHNNSSRTIIELEKVALHIEGWDGKILKILQRNEQCEESYLLFDVSNNQWLTPTPEP